jgi:drug/metabolite transporter (DMT)-like permease
MKTARFDAEANPPRPLQEVNMPSSLKSDLMLVITAVIWGFAFTAQRMGMDHIGPFTYSAVRFALGAAMLLPLAIFSVRRRIFTPPEVPGGMKVYLWGGGLAGVALYGGISFQQTGLVYTSAGNAGFITGLYVVIVPIIGLIWRQSSTAGSWLGAILAAAGLYLLSVTEDFGIGRGDLLVLCGAVIWALHVHIIARIAPRADPLMLAVIQFAICTLLSWASALIFETILWDGIVRAALPILYGGVMSVGVAYTLQVVAQRHAHPAHAAIILSLEVVFAAVGGWWILDEHFTSRALLGCGLMLAGMLLSQLYGLIGFKKMRSELGAV